MTVKRCPICEQPTNAAYAPFCCKRCADVDLHRWLAGAYVIPGEEEDVGSDAGQSGDVDKG
jgi:endogenous inhibitor of DNA gyrase (YacG/DUF329 family)